MRSLALLVTALAAATAASPVIPNDVADLIQLRELQRRGLSDLLNTLVQGMSVNDITQGILPDFFNWIPTTDKIKSQLGISDAGIAGLPIKVLNIPGYANWTSNSWNLRMHGWAYKEPFSFNNGTSIVTTQTLDQAVNVFLPNLKVDQLQPNEQVNARNLTSAILSLPQDDVQLEFYLDVEPGQNFTSLDWTARLIWPQLTDARGEFDGFIALPVTPPGESASWLPDGSQTNSITRLDVHTNGTDTGNSTAYLVPPEGVIILSDIDDVLRVTKIWAPSEGLLNTFARDFTPWLNMPERFAEWSQQSSGRPYHFHYLTTTPEQATRKYMDFIYTHYPLGSFDTRSLNFTTVDQTFNVRKSLIDKIVQTFPQRKFILIGDTSNSDVMTDYPAAAKQYGNIQCILIRNSTATDSTMNWPYNTAGFRDLNGKFMFFRTPDDLAGLNFANGDCVNGSVPMNVTYAWQNLPFGLSISGASHNEGGKGARPGVEKVWWVLMVAAATAWWGIC